jgi:succinoglycan biosynthesis protein ExoA
MTLPLVTIAMPAFNEERFIETCIRSVWAQDYPRDRLEILVADGRSTDRTREILAELAATDPRIQLIDNPERLQAAGLGHIVKQARGDVIVRMDVHCEYAADYVSKCITTLQATGADNVGGAQRAKAKTPFQQALCAALRSPLGVGGASYRSATAEGFVDTVFLGAFRRAVFERVGLWDPAAATNEDAELNQRILEAGGRIYLSPDIEVHYFPRESLRALAKQYFRYGRGRARTLLMRGKLPKLRPLVPFFLVSGAAAMMLVPPAWPLLPPAAAAYLLACGAEAVRVAGALGPRAVATAAAIFPVLHFSHGSGFALGLLHYLRHPDWPAEHERLAPRAHLRAV